MNNLFKFSFILLIIAILSEILIPFLLKNRSINPSNHHIYVVTIHTFNGDITELSDSIISKDKECITFINAYKAEQTICGNYSLTKY